MLIQPHAGGREVNPGTGGRVAVVLGMHRSGTSLCMNILALLGIRMSADLLPANKFNERGFFESREILQLNESILRAIGLTWHSIPPSGFHEDWIDDPAIEDAKQLPEQQHRTGPSASEATA